MKYILLIVMSLSLFGCSILLPYNETFICNVPEGQGYCGSVTDVYEYSNKSRGRL